MNPNPPAPNNMAEDLPTLSIVTCSFQQARFLDATMQSVLGQGYPRLEYLVLDGGSTDGSVDVIRRHADRLAYWCSERDAGQSDALSRGFERSRGEIQGWLCSDDLLLPGALHTVGRYFADHPEVDFVYGDALWIDANGDPLRAKKEPGWSRFVMSFDHNYLAQPACFWRRRLYESTGGLDRNFHLSMDSDLWLRFAHRAQPVHLPVYLACMRHHAAQKTQALKPRAREEDRRLREREWPRLSRWPTIPLRWAARASRVALKLAEGGYLVRPPASASAWLQQLRTPG